MTHVKRQPDRDGEVGEGSEAYLLTTPVNPHILDAELSSTMNWRKDSGLVSEGNPMLASEADPVTLWVLRGSDVDAAAFKKVVAAHEPPGEPEEDPLVALREKVRAGDPLDDDEAAEALRLLILRS